jgi:hypothetical protein
MIPPNEKGAEGSRAENTNHSILPLCPPPSSTAADALRADDLRRAAYHEAGHVIAARHFKLYAWADVFPTGTKKPREEKTFIGRTYHQHTTPFREAVIGWAGLIATDIPTDPEALTDWGVDIVFDYTMTMIDLEDEMSATDRASILGHPQLWRACRTAGAILARRIKEVGLEAESLMCKWREGA